jgi:hypothetical protein
MISKYEGEQSLSAMACELGSALWTLAYVFVIYGVMKGWGGGKINLQRELRKRLFT